MFEGVCARSGFTKDCKCCRETGYNEKVVTLRRCYDQDGQLLQGALSQMQVSRVTCHVYITIVTCTPVL